jgi:hypothetical protein
MHRRTFLSTLGLAAAAGILPSAARSLDDGPVGTGPESPDFRSITDRLRRGAREDLAKLPVGELVVAMGRTLLGLPYKANTLEQPGEEHLVVNLREFDCVTFCENALALARTVGLGMTTVADFKRQLQMIRYRGGTIDGYQSRLHYFSDWVADNHAKGVVRDITRSLGGQRDTRTIAFMSEHRSAYPRLTDEAAFAKIKEAEGRLNAAPRYILPKTLIHRQPGSFRSGDIVGITTSIAGLDCTHTGILVEDGGAVKMMHASLDGKRVMMTDGTLDEYLDLHPKNTGVIVARPSDV